MDNIDKGLERAIELLRKEYKRACELTWIHSPLAYALYQTWKIVNKEDTNSNGTA